MGGPGVGVTCGIVEEKFKCTANTPAGDAPIEKEHYRCVLLAREGRCPPEWEDRVRHLGIPCGRPETPTPWKNAPKDGPTLPQCPPGQIFISGKCFPFRP